MRDPSAACSIANRAFDNVPRGPKSACATAISNRAKFADASRVKDALPSARFSKLPRETLTFPASVPATRSPSGSETTAEPENVSADSDAPGADTERPEDWLKSKEIPFPAALSAAWNDRGESMNGSRIFPASDDPVNRLARISMASDSMAAANPKIVPEPSPSKR